MAAFAFVMDTVAPEEATEEGGASDPAGAPAGTGDGSSAPADQGANPTGEPAGTPVGGAPVDQNVDGGNSVLQSAGAPQPGQGTVDASSLSKSWGEVLTGIEAASTQSLEREAYDEAREEYGQFFDAVEVPPRSLIGQEVVKIGDPNGGTEILRDSADVKDWQEGMKAQLISEIKDRASRKADDVKGMMDTLHASVGIFQNNVDLVPGTKQFDKELADKFSAMVKPYELRIEGKLTGYTIPVQPFIDTLRAQITAGRTAAPVAPAAPATPTAQQQRVAEQPRTPVGTFAAPQVGLTSKSGASADGAEDYSTLFGTLGLPGFRI